MSGWLEVFYNSDRLHSTLGMHTSTECEQLLCPGKPQERREARIITRRARFLDILTRRRSTDFLVAQWYVLTDCPS